MLNPVEVLIWTCIVVFAATALITLLALIGIITLGGGKGERHNYYLNRLFAALILEIVVVSLTFFSGYLVKENQGLVRENQGLVNSISSPSEEDQVVVDQKNLPEAGQVLDEMSISDSIYVTSDGPREQTLTIPIPKGWKYVEHSININNQNNDSRLDPVRLVRREDGEVEGVSVHAVADPQALFGPRNWLGAELTVKVQADVNN